MSVQVYLPEVARRRTVDESSRVSGPLYITKPDQCHGTVEERLFWSNGLLYVKLLRGKRSSLHQAFAC